MDTDDPPSSSKSKKPRANRAHVHDEFVEIEVVCAEKKKKVKKSQCKHCAPDSRFRVLAGRNPSNLRDHLEAHHKDVFARVKGIFLLNQI